MDDVVIVGGGIKYDKYYKDTFKQRSKDRWYEISKKYHIKSLILPVNWKINLDISLIGENYIYYKF